MDPDTQGRAADQREPGIDSPSGPKLNRAAAVATSAALGGAVSAALVGSVAGPVGPVIGAALGAIAAGIGGNTVAKSVDAEAEAACWQDNFRDRPHVHSGASFDDCAPAYGHGVAIFMKYPDSSFEEVESELPREWNASRSASRLEWEHEREASLDAWWRARHGLTR